MRRRPGPVTRTRRSITAGLLCLTAGVIAVLFGLPGVDFSLARYVLFVAGGASVVAGLLLLSMRLGAIAAAAFVAAVAFEGPISANGAAALRLLDAARVPGYTATARGFLGNARQSPYRVFVGPSNGATPDAPAPSMVRVPSGFRLDATRSGAGALTNLPLHEGFTSLASWRAPRPGEAPCMLELEVVDSGRLAAALAVAPKSVRSSLDGRTIVRLVATCSPTPAPRPGRSSPNGGPLPNAEQTPLQRGGPR